ncbi:hypothetical protein DP113_20230 [Brasilonema octagenarum UFV-E1]|uniref:Uncharacterized protein n=2 Tax=Brasilonema TaxID=383614 RepID=A0A856MH37_9CYAN|nr:hypothetical protein [Brasilonema octagenarum UFV-OR1]QDL09912.1 hypothetical protein DP114_20305 [Brasilonema sennae CENA114]QDL16264.1 hypothetical protein DP113_20230 [Brasilonema octagenarum UFV-E1]
MKSIFLTFLLILTLFNILNIFFVSAISLKIKLDCAIDYTFVWDRFAVFLTYTSRGSQKKGLYWR